MPVPESEQLSSADLDTIKRVRLVPIATPGYFKYRDEIDGFDLKHALPKTIFRGDLVPVNVPLSELSDSRNVKVLFKVMALNDQKGQYLSSGRFDKSGTEILVSRTPTGHRLPVTSMDEVQFNKEQVKSLEEIVTKALETKDNQLATIMLMGPSGFGKRTALVTAMQRLGIPLFKPVGVTKEKHDSDAINMAQYQPCCIQVDHKDFSRVHKKLTKVQTSSGLVLVSILDGLDPTGLDGIQHMISFLLLSKSDREILLISFLPDDMLTESLATTTGLSLGDMFQLKRQVLHRKDMKCDVSMDLLSILVKEIRLSRSKQSALAQKVTWDQVAGLEEAKRLIRETLDFPLNRKNQLCTTLGRRTGLLLHGPPGTGKTLLAKAIATEYQLSFMAVKGPELMSMYIGETESNIRELFQEARLNQPTVLFFDELDSLATRRGEDADSGGITDRIVAQLMVEIDRLAEDVESTVFLIGATNRPDLIDPALLRPGRIDKAVYLGAPTTKSEQVAILKASCRDMNLDESVFFEALQLSLDYSPADLANVCRSAMRIAIRNKIGDLEKGLGTPTDLVKVTQENFTEACKLVRPSLKPL